MKWQIKYPDWVNKNGNLKPNTPREVREDVYDFKLAELSTGVIRIGQYHGRKQIIWHKCGCGKEFEANPDTVLAGGQCKQCRYEKTRKKNALSCSEYDEELVALGSGVERLGEYVNQHRNIKHRCPCGNEDWMPKPMSVLRGGHCPSCGHKKRGENRRYTHDEYVEILLRNGIKILPLEPYIDMRTSIKHQCECGGEYVQSPQNALRNFKCEVCIAERRSEIMAEKMTNHSRYVRRLEERDRIDIIPLEPYRGGGIPIKHRCPRCKREDWLVKPRDALYKAGVCKDCAEFTADNNALYLVVDQAGIYKFGHTSWVHGESRFAHINRSRKRELPHPKPRLCEVIRYVRVKGKATVHEDHLLGVFDDNPYEGARFDGQTETRRLCKVQLETALSYIDGIALEHYDTREVNASLSYLKQAAGDDFFEIEGYWAERIDYAVWDGHKCEIYKQAKYFPNRAEGRHWEGIEPIQERVLKDLGKTVKKSDSTLPTGVTENRVEQSGNVYCAISVSTRLGGKTMKRTFSYGKDRTREQSIKLAINERDRQIREMLADAYPEHREKIASGTSKGDKPSSHHTGNLQSFQQ